MKIANIVCERDIKIDKRFNLVNSINNSISDLPTLIVGIDNAKEYLGKSNKISYLDRKINKNTFWTFNRIEKRDLFEEDLFYFIEFSYNQLLCEVKFNFIDLILSNTKTINSILLNIKDDKESITFHYKNMVYTHINDNIYGFDLRQVAYIGKSPKKFIDTIKSFSTVFLQDEKILIEYKKELYMFNDEVKYVPLIYFIRNNE
tara:strand:+ start:26087 stop:26695 length:609 start_codon:yes stop_codon:yes gene_type:complete